MQRHGQISISGLILQEKASQFWDNMPIYAELSKPKFSEGWLDRFKRRYKIKKLIYHGESGSAESGEAVENRLASIQKILADFQESDIYNMDETDIYIPFS